MVHHEGAEDKEKKGKAMRQRQQGIGCGGSILVCIGVLCIIYLATTIGHATQAPTASAPLASDTALVAATSVGAQDAVSTETAAPADTPRPHTALESFPALATVVAGDNNDTPAIAKLRSFVWEPSTNTLSVAFNIDQNLTMDFIRGGIKTEMSDIYTAAFRSALPVQTVNVAAWGPFQDKFGNATYDPAYTTTMTRDVASQINWNANQSVLELTIIPGLWQVNYAQASMGF